jgi:hypothetical protein
VSPRIIFHLGAPKTGSGALQRCFRENEVALAQAGILYPRSKHSGKKEGGGNARPLAAYFEGGDAEPYREFLESLSTDAAHVIWSSEFLFNARGPRPEEAISRLRREGFTPVAVVYVRPQDELTLSAYSQLIRNHGLTRALEDFAAEFYYGLSERLEQAEQLFGRENLRVRVYGQFHGGSIVSDFFCAVRMEVPDITPRRVNSSLSAEQAAILRYANTLTTDKWVQRAIQRMADKWPLPSTALSISEQLQRFLMERYADENALITARYLAGQVLEIVPSAGAVTTEYALSPIEREAIAELVRLLSKRRYSSPRNR